MDEYVVDWRSIRKAQLRARNHIQNGHWLKLLPDDDELGPWWKPAIKGPSALSCLALKKDGDICIRVAGAGTNHTGVGLCSLHGGRSEDESMMGAWIMAHAFSLELQCTPWEALLKVVRIAAGKVKFCEYKISTAGSDADLEPGGELFFWVTMSERWTLHLMNASKTAIAAGVAERLVRQVELEGQLMVEATRRTLDEMGFDDDQRDRAMQLMAKHVLELESKVNDYDIVDVTELKSIERGV